MQGAIAYLIVLIFGTGPLIAQEIASKKYYNGTKIIIKVYEYKGNSVSVHCFHLLSFYVNNILNMNYGIQ